MKYPPVPTKQRSWLSSLSAAGRLSARAVANLGLAGDLAEGHGQAAQMALTQAIQGIALIALGHRACLVQARHPVSGHDAGIVSGGNPLSPTLSAASRSVATLSEGIAQDTRVRCASSSVSVQERLDRVRRMPAARHNAEAGWTDSPPPFRLRRMPARHRFRRAMCQGRRHERRNPVR